MHAYIKIKRLFYESDIKIIIFVQIKISIRDVCQMLIFYFISFI